MLQLPLKNMLNKKRKKKKLEKDFLPSHTKSWDNETRQKYEFYIKEQKDLASNRNIIQEGDKVVLVLPRFQRFAIIGKGKFFKAKRIKADLGVTIGHPYGTMFEFNQRKKKLEVVEKMQIEGEYDASFVPSKNNSKLFDDQKSQSLRAEEIHKLKDNKSAEELVAIIAKNSTTFKNKTAYSKEKYLKRKMKKHAIIVTVLRPTPELICRMYYDSINGYKDKHFLLRYDTMAQLISVANIRANTINLVVDSTEGLLLAAIAQRVGGFGYVLHGHTKHKPKLNLFHKINSSRRVIDSLVHFPLSALDTLLNPSFPPHKHVEQTTVETSTDFVNIGQKMLRHEQLGMVAKILRQKVDSLILCSKFDPTYLLDALFPLLIPSGILVIFSHTMAPLVQCMKILKQRGVVCNTKISDTWTRSYQILPNRTHPVMNTSSSSGYLLSAYKLK